MADGGPLQSGSAPVTWAEVAQGTVGTDQGKHGEWGLWASLQDLTLTTEGPATQGDGLPAHVSSDLGLQRTQSPPSLPRGHLSWTPWADVGSGLGVEPLGEHQGHEAPGEDSTEVWLDGGLGWD